MMMNVCIVVGARPNFMKAAPIIWAIDKAKSAGKAIDYKLVYTGVAADPTIEPTLFEDLLIPAPDAFLGVESVSLNELTGRVMSEFERYLQKSPADIVIVVDDLASTMAVAIVAKKCGLCLAHLVAGTRSFDITMPKEINRLVIDGLSDLLFTAGAGSSSVATREGVELSQIYMVGNLLMDTLRVNQSRLRRPAVLRELKMEDGGYLVLTINRKALLSDTVKLRELIETLASAKGAVPVVAPLRDAARDALAGLRLEESGVHVTAPLPYLEFGYLLSHAKGIVTDSGNVAEEATFDNVPCITINSYTEHIETVKQGTNVLVGEDSALLRKAVSDMVGGQWKKSTLPERWDGRTAERIVQILLEQKPRGK